MKKYLKSLMLLLPLLIITGSCNKFLDRPPFDDIDDSNYWKTEAHVRTFATGFYTSFFGGFGTGVAHGGFGIGQSTTDDTSTNVQYEWTPLRIPESGSIWSTTTIRRVNYMIEKVQGMSKLTEEQKNHWLGVARLFRATNYCSIVTSYGDCPWYDKVLTTGDRAELYKDRDPRTYVMDKVVEDFKFAMDNIRTNDGTLQVNRYVAGAMASRYLLREGTFQKYYYGNTAKAAEYLAVSKTASELVINGPFSVSDNYEKLFYSDDLAGNPEVIIYRKYLDAQIMHSTLEYYNTSFQQNALTKDLAEDYLTKDALPVYATNNAWAPKTAAEFFKDRDPRLVAAVRGDKYYLQGEDNTPFNYSTSGYSVRKFVDPAAAGSADSKWNRERNTTDCPVYRLGEVLLNYAEASYELGTLTQADLDKSINKLRSRKGVNIPALEIINGQPAVNGVVYDDPKRVQIDPEVPAMLWEIRRERRIELYSEGLRYSDLKRWKKLDYMYNGKKPSIRLGAYIRYADYPKVNKTAVKFLNSTASEGWMLCNQGAERLAPENKHYILPVDKAQIKLYKDNKYTLTQTLEWQNEE